ncbi:MAG: Nramp family divalent metal transporter [Terriglobia bacterium]
MFIFLVTVNLLFVPFSHWIQTLWGFVEFGRIPPDVDWLLLGALAATAGSGGIGNLAISNWIRDKGFGMGGKVGAIPSAIGSHEIKLSHIGSIFPVTAENLRRWRLWWKYVEVDQVWLWGLGCLAGMFLNINLATATIPHGTDLSRVGAGAFQAQYLAEHLWSGFWFLALLNGFWILFSTQLGNTDILVRTVTDILWVANPRARAW